MKKEELRIGNHVRLVPKFDHYAPNEDGIVVIKEIDSDSVVIGDDNRRFRFASIMEINITPKILTDVGFNNGNTIDTWYHPQLGCMYVRLPHRDSKHFLIKAIGDTPITSFKYLHHLENFFYAVTGNEFVFNNQKTTT